MGDSRWDAVRGEIESAWIDRSRLERPEARSAVEGVIAALDRGELRVAEPTAVVDSAVSSAFLPLDGGEPPPWIVHAWIKEAILLYFALRPTESFEVGPFHFRDKIPLKQDPEGAGIRVVPPATIRYGSFLERGVVAMPCYVNIGARIGAGTMIDTWATVGSCAQIGRHVHVSGGVGIGGVLEPPQAQPVVIEDEAFLGSRVIVVEGVRVGEGAVLGAGLVLTASTPIVDVRSAAPVTHRGIIPPRAVVIPGQLPKRFPAGEYGVPCALVIGERRASTDRKTSLNELLREYPLEP